MKKSSLFALPLLIALSAVALPAAGGQGATQGDQAKAALGAALQVINPGFSAEEKAVIEKYFGAKASDKGSESDADGDGGKKGKGKKHKGLPPGLAKKDKLPPGLAKKDKLPPGLERRALPEDLMSQLPACAKKEQCAIVGTDVVLVEKGTEVILDVINNAISKP